MVIQCVTLENSHYFHSNLILGQHRLRYQSIIKRQNWEVPSINEMEYDQYDNPAATYLVWRDSDYVVKGVSRLYPTDRPFMLQEHFSHMLEEGAMPTGKDVLEGSRFCIDKSLSPEMRVRVARELVCAYYEYGLDHNISKIIGIMYPIYWRNLFIQNGVDVSWLGSANQTPDGKKSRPGSFEISHEILKVLREKTGISESVIKYFDEERKYAEVV